MLIAALKFEFCVQFNEGKGEVSSDEIFYPTFFLWCMDIRMRRCWTM